MNSVVTDYRFEQARLDSFTAEWSCKHVQPADLATAGFYWTGYIDRVRCFECRTEICRWEDGDNPMTEHQRWGGRCRFIRQRSCDNVPIGSSDAPIRPRRSRDVCGSYRHDYRLNATADRHTTTNQSTGGSYAVNPTISSDASIRPRRSREVDAVNLTISSDAPIRPQRSRDVDAVNPTISSTLTTLFPDVRLTGKSDPKNILDTITSITSIYEDLLSKYKEVIDKLSVNSEKLAERIERSERASTDLSHQLDFIICKICCDAKIGTVFLPCGHVVSCIACAKRLYSCPICRKTIREYVRIYFV